MPTPDTPTIAITGMAWATPSGYGRVDDCLRKWADQGLGTFDPNDRCPHAIVDTASQDEIGAHSGPGGRQAAAVLAAARIAVEQSGGPPVAGSARVGLHLGSQFCGHVGMVAFGKAIVASGARFVSPLVFPETVGNYAASSVARCLDIRGPNQTICTGPDSGLAAILESCTLLENHRADRMLAGGGDVIEPELLDAWIEQNAPAPTVKSLTGALFAEAACILVLERTDDARARGADILGTIECQHGPRDGVSQAGAATIQPDSLWGNTFAAGGAIEVALAAAALHGMPVPLLEPVAGDRPAEVRLRELPKHIRRIVVTALQGDGSTLAVHAGT